MICPYCGKEMEPGMITNYYEMTWYKAGKRGKLTVRPKNQEDSVLLSDMSLTRGSAVEAFLCRDCQKIIIDYTDGNCDLNKR